MTEKPTCPDRGRLESLLAGSLSDADQGAVTEHVEACESCQKTLDTLAGGSRDEQARRLADPPTTLDPALEQVMSDALAGETQAAEVRTAGDESLAFLDPPREPGHLGRLKHYEVLELVGKGGFGFVFKALDEKLQRIIAIKVLAPELAASATARRRFAREAQAAAAVRNEHVVAIYEVNDEHSPPYLVMEFIAGLSLQDRLDRDGPLEVREVLRIGLQAAEGLAAAHKQGLVHRDIKPANILLENGVQRVKITDFGLARAVDDASLSQSGVIAGTPMYMSPEQAQGEALDHRSDLFSLGSVMYATCTGRPPFRANSTLAVLKRVCEESARPIRESNPEVPEWVCAVIEKLQSKRAGDRFASARELADLLGQGLAHAQQPGANPAPPALVEAVPAAAPVTRRRRRRILAASAALLALVVAVGLLWHFLLPSNSPPPPDDPGTPAPDAPTPVVAPPLAIAPFGEKQAKEHQEAWAKYLGVDTEITNSIGMKLRLIPPGEFVMGTSPADLEAVRKVVQEKGGIVSGEETLWEDEAVQRRVRLTRPYYLGCFEVTRSQFEQFVEATGSKTYPEKNGGGFSLHPTGWVRRPEHVWKTPGPWRVFPDEPVAHLTWADGRAFCQWLSQEEGWQYVLPTEAQWEFACRAGTEGLTHCDKGTTLDDYAWMRESATAGPDGHRPRRVGLKRPNAFGLYDMLGNVWEICTDYSRPGAATTGMLIDPQGTSAERVYALRGGCWHRSGAVSARCGGHAMGHPDFTDSGNGFRVVLIAPEKGTLSNKGGLALFKNDDRAFVVLAKDNRPESRHHTLPAAVDAAQSGDTIEIQGNGPFTTTPIVLGKALTFRAGKRWRPVFVHTSDGRFLSTTAVLVLEGLEFHSFGNKFLANERQYGLIEGRDSSLLRIAHCRFLATGELHPISADTALLEVRDSQILSDWGVIAWGPTVKGRAVVANCLILSTKTIESRYSEKPSQDAEVELTGNTCVLSVTCYNHRLFRDPLDIDQNKDSRQVRFKAVENVFQSRSFFSLVEHWDADRPYRPEALTGWYHDHVAWEARDNLFDIKGDYLGVTKFASGKKPERACKTLKDWQTFWKAEQSPGNEGAVQLNRRGMLEQTPWDVLSIVSVTPADFRLVKGSPGQGVLPGGKDLGADVDRVGPGKAYEEWKKTNEYKEWRKKTDEMMKVR